MQNTEEFTYIYTQWPLQFGTNSLGGTFAEASSGSLSTSLCLELLRQPIKPLVKTITGRGAC